MSAVSTILKSIVAAFAVTVVFSIPSVAQSARLDELFEQLAQPDQPDRTRVEEQIWTEWSKSGSAAMDLLLARGRKAIEDQDWPLAIEHLSALIDHAPNFAEGWNLRATAYYQAGLYGLSVEDIRHALALNPKHFGALSGLAMIFEELGDKPDALKALEAVKAIHPYREGLEDAIDRLEKEVGGQTL